MIYLLNNQLESLNHLENGILINSFNNFHFRKNGQVIHGVKWRTAKAKELFSYLLYKNNYASKIEIINLLWTEHDQEKAIQNLYITIYQIKEMCKSLQLEIDIINTGNGYELVLNNIQHDVHILEKTLENITEITEDNYLLIKNVLNLYTGDYLQEENYVWKENRCEQLKLMYVSTVYKMMEYLEQNEEYMLAIMLGLRAQKLYPQLQSNYLKLMDLYDKIGDYDNVEKQYSLLNHKLRIEYNQLPNTKVSNWYANWKYNTLIK